ncbi:hypothetical protein IKQ26_07480 [bacterium]|nr:hypothetical protein [bacterium]
MNKSKLKNLMDNFCCSNCKSDFEEESLTIVREEAGLIVVQISCQNCGKSFGIALLGVSELDIKEPVPFEMEDCPDKISCDDVIDAHNFIKNLDENWQKYLPK